jgi:glucose-1-phosphate thymidylyltransferase
MNIVLFEDALVEDNYPASLGRPAFGITCGVYCLYDAARLLGSPIRTVVRDYLRATAQRRFPGAEVTTGPTLYLNASLAPDVRAVRRLRDLAGKGQAFVAPSGRRVAAAFLPNGPWLPADAQSEAVTPFLLESRAPRVQEDLPTLDYPFHVIQQHPKLFGPNLADLMERRRLREHAPGVYVGEGVKIAATAVFHPDDGPIVLDDGVTVLDFTYLTGPLYVGPKSRIIERSSVKEQVFIGPTCKIGGEIECSVIEAYTNKQHHGFLGHSYVGSWVNMGAGTSNSDLKNTYGMVRMEVNGERLDTGMQFVGCVIGDYSKTAINTSIFTGKIVGASSMLYGFVTTNVPSFCNYARSFGEVTAMSVEAALETQKRMFLRRKVEQTADDVALMHAMHQRTRHERMIASEPLSL